MADATLPRDLLSPSPMNAPSAEEFYRKLHTGTPGDVDFYSRLVDGSAHVLELGCGFGRLTRPLAEKCRAITGVDKDPVFCAAAKALLAGFPHARIVQHDLEVPWPTDSVPEKYDRVIAPYNLLYALGGASGVVTALKFVRESLAIDGEFWADIYPVDDMHAAFLAGETPPDDDDEPVGEFDWENERYPVLERSTLDLERQHLDVDYQAVDPKDRKSVLIESSLRHDYLLLEQIDALLQDAGLEIALLLGGFDGRPYDEDAEQLVLCARHLSPP